MDSDKAADVRDAINGLPCVAHEPEPNRNYGEGTTRVKMHGPESLNTGPCVHLDEFSFSAAEINEAGEISFDGGAPRPCYEVLLQPLALPRAPLPTISIPPGVVHEVAKYDCRLRVSAGLRGEHTPGTIRIRDDLAHNQDPDKDGDRCGECGSTRFKLKDGVPECVRCGNCIEVEQTDHTPKLGDYA